MFCVMDLDCGCVWDCGGKLEGIIGCEEGTEKVCWEVFWDWVEGEDDEIINWG